MTGVKLAPLVTLLYAVYSLGGTIDRGNSAREQWAASLAGEADSIQFSAVGATSKTLEISLGEDTDENIVRCDSLLSDVLYGDGKGFLEDIRARGFIHISCGVLVRPIAVQGAIQPRDKPKCCSSGGQVALEMDS
jgi:hypothetical protein